MKVVPIAISSTGPPPPPLQAVSLCTDRHYSAILHRETVCHTWSTIFFSGKQLQLPYFESKEITLLIIHRSQRRHLCWVHLWQDVEAESMTYLVMDSSVRLFFKSAN